MIDDAVDPVVRQLRQLEMLAPHQRLAEQVRERCRARLRRPPPRESRLGPALVAGLCVLYLFAIVIDVLRLRGVIWPSARRPRLATGREDRLLLRALPGRTSFGLG